MYYNQIVGGGERGKGLSAKGLSTISLPVLCLS